MKSVFNLRRDFPRIHEMRAAESIAIVQHVAVIREIQRGQAYRPLLSEGFPQSEIKRCMRRQMCGTVSVQETRAVACVEIG